MASDYGLNFGFRRSDESMRSGPEGRLRVPATGTFKQGDLVTFDAANPGFIKLAPANSPIDPGFTGLLIQEDAWDRGIHENQIFLTQDLDVVRNGNLCAIWTGGGLKVWMRNTPARSNPGQRSRVAVQKIDTTGLGIGDTVGWDGGKYVKTTTATAVVGRATLVTAAVAGSEYAEIVLAK